ncbi:MAG: 5-(carboxyamino)imidazole ribonucleotide synthase [Planctomycetaceae bacterium]|nr:5-(carboxyamino)imidazole ribonucleotide synthase [Planctomycetaceae bacterium]
MSRPIPPGSTLGVLGSGQLGRMFAIAARRLGYRVHVLSPDDDTPTGQVADLEIRAAYDDLDAVAAFARGVSVVTFEFENVPAATTAACERFALVRPGGNVLHTSQNRLREKSFLTSAGIPVTPFWPVRSRGDLAAALAQAGTPAVLKTADWGYDGKGQAKLASADELDRVWPKFAGGESILESFIDFQCEISVVGARGADGSRVAYGPMQNSHVNHILDLSFAPAAVPPGVAAEAIEITREILRRLEVVGVLCVEFFVDRSERLMVNELAPRPHNSGHLTIDACTTCQFEQQVRAVCGLPLGSPRQHRPAAMANLLGELWQSAPPNWPAALAQGDVKLHLYGKAEPRIGRKMGHLTALAETADEAARRVLAARAALVGRRV